MTNALFSSLLRGSGQVRRLPLLSSNNNNIRPLHSLCCTVHHCSQREQQPLQRQRLCVSRPQNKFILQQQQQQQYSQQRFMTTDDTSASLMSTTELNQRLNEFQDLFVEARLTIEDVVDAADTTYFDEEVEAATEAVNAAVQCYGAILDDMKDEDQKNSVRRSNGLKVEQLKGELELAVKGGH